MKQKSVHIKKKKTWLFPNQAEILNLASSFFSICFEVSFYIKFLNYQRSKRHKLQYNRNFGNTNQIQSVLAQINVMAHGN